MYKHMLRKIIVSIFLLLVVCAVRSPALFALPHPVTPSCRYELEMTIAAERLFLKDAFAAGKGWHMEYLLTTELLDPHTNQYKVKTENGEMTAGEHVRYKKTDAYEMYFDEHDLFSINKRGHSILHTKTSPSALKTNSDTYSQIFQDSLFKLMELVSCQKVKVNNGELVCYSLKSNLLRCPYAKMFIYAEPVSRNIRKLQLNMNLQYQKDIKEITFEIMQKNVVALNPAWVEIRKLFLNDDGRLKSPYSTYKLVDTQADKEKNTKKTKKSR